jgi:undecaprenyl-diphosphatase
MRTTILVTLLGIALSASAQEPPDSTPSQPVMPAQASAKLTWGDALILGLVEGVTEFLPVSSTGHLLIANEALGLNENYPLTRADGSPIWVEAPGRDNPAGIPFTRKHAVDSYSIIIQIGGIAAVVLLYWQRLRGMTLGIFGFNREGLALARNIFVALLPAVLIGLTVGDWIEETLFSVGAVIVALAVGAVLMFWVQAWQTRSSWRIHSERDAADLTPAEALFIGVFQCVAFWPGTSRSMVTIVGGYLTGLSPAKAAEFSFLLGLPTLAGAALLKGIRTGPLVFEVLGWGPVIVGCLVAFVSAAVAIKFLVSALVRFGLGPFAVYRLILALGLVLTFGI